MTRLWARHVRNKGLFCGRARDFLSFSLSRLPLASIQPLIQWVMWNEAATSPSSAMYKTAQCYSSSPSQIFMVLCFVKHRVDLNLDLAVSSAGDSYTGLQWGKIVRYFLMHFFWSQVISIAYVSELSA
jgi:hypothetical protein